MSEYERIKESVKAVIPAIYEDSVYDADIIEDLIQAADKEIATKDEQNRLTCCAIADMTPASEYSDAIEDAMSEWDAVKIARLVIAEYKFKLDCEAARIADKDAELARLREESRSWRSVAERLEREKQLSLHAWVSSDSEDSE